MVLNRLFWSKLDKFLEETFIEWHDFFRITINTTVSSTPSPLFLFCRLISVIVFVAISFILVFAAVVDAAFLIILII